MCDDDLNIGFIKKDEDIFLDLGDPLFILLPITTLAVHFPIIFLIYHGMSEPVWKPGGSNWSSIICRAVMNSFSANGVPGCYIWDFIGLQAVGGWGFELYFFVSQQNIAAVKIGIVHGIAHKIWTYLFIVTQ